MKQSPFFLKESLLLQLEIKKKKKTRKRVVCCSCFETRFLILVIYAPKQRGWLDYWEAFGWGCVSQMWVLSHQAVSAVPQPGWWDRTRQWPLGPLPVLPQPQSEKGAPQNTQGKFRTNRILDSVSWDPAGTESRVTLLWRYWQSNWTN